MNKKPNIIIFNPDQMRADSLHHLGNPASITPTLDQMSITVWMANSFKANIKTT